MNIKPFYDNDTATISYVVADEKSKQCAIIDSVLNLDPQSGKTEYTGANTIIKYIQEQQLTVEWILETHIHADHLTASQYLKEKLGGKLGIGSNIKAVFDFWNPFFQLNADGSQFDQLFDDHSTFTIGTLKVEVMHTPGHTPACSSYKIGNVIFVGDTLFKPESGTSRADFPGGSPESLYHSIQKILSLPDETHIYLCHDYPKEGDSFQFVTTVGEEKQHNIMIKQGTSLEEYKQKREAKDKILSVPRLLLPSLQVNILGGEFPFKESNGSHYLKIPFNKLS